ncbi:2-succinyl-5-enolpyruvyl-6-hydroxy-3-cyclohexene-1-carboxylic-acid synthase [Tumidithrix helvetica PCC 7403]|uniref:2-succinyl-5-enolpyruvyl-6-hydroxy-3- cyclohexene-1-carboxylic-acid synthase n=1 Tax=Tumidithrix helvetica TaxID=3457545 RepID=UPI003CB12322
MNTANRNTLWASIVAEELYRSGVRTICISPGSRSTPLAIAFAALRSQVEGLEILIHIDERSSSFFALGLAKVRSEPVVLLCTSGSAAANYYPAIVEAYYSGIPLVILTADRPPELRDCGAGQTIDQIKLYGNHVRYFFEVGTPAISGMRLRYLRSLVGRVVSMAEGKAYTLAGPVHLNFAFADPLIPVKVTDDLPEDLEVSDPTAWHGRQNVERSEQTSDRSPIPSPSQRQAYVQTVTGRMILSTDAIATLANQITSHPQGVIVVGVYDAPASFAKAVRRLSQATGYPLLAESTGLDRRGAIGHYDSFLRSPQFCQTYAPELAIRFGAMPTSKRYQLWLEQHIQCQQIIVGTGNNDPTHGLTQSIYANPINFCDQLADYLENYTLPSWRDRDQNKKWRQGFERAESIVSAAIAEFLASVDELFDGKVFAELGKWLPANTHIYIASSTPIRDLDTFFHSQQPIKVLANRGANGIDGTLSSALGAAWGCEEPMLLICGDLAFYHDLNGLMAVKKYNVNLTVILLNNDGGGIFDLLPIANFEPPFEELFGTPHGLDFAPIVTAYGGEFVEIKDWQHFQQAVLDSLQRSGTQVLEVKSDRKQNKVLHQMLWSRISDLIDRSFKAPPQSPM